LFNPKQQKKKEDFVGLIKRKEGWYVEFPGVDEGNV
jgi:hypothetical protein